MSPSRRAPYRWAYSMTLAGFRVTTVMETFLGPVRGAPKRGMDRSDSSDWKLTVRGTRRENPITVFRMCLRSAFWSWPFRFQRLLLIAFACTAITHAWAVNPKVDITQYSHTAWRTEEGLFAGSPQKITQTNDGYLWIGTANGLYRLSKSNALSWNAGGPTRNNGLK